MRLEILTEEKSMECFLEGLLPRILPEGFALGQNCFIHSHEGKSQLLKSIPKKMKAYPYFPEPVRVLIIHDQDSNDCKELKSRLQSLCSPEILYLIRIACKELENWYLGDFDAIEQSFPEVKASHYRSKAKFRNPDKLHGADEMSKLTKNLSKTAAARRIAPIINIEINQSESFNQLLNGITKLLTK